MMMTRDPNIDKPGSHIIAIDLDEINLNNALTGSTTPIFLSPF